MRCRREADGRSVRTMTRPASNATERELAGLVRRCYAGLDAEGLRSEIAAGLRRVLAVDAAFVATVDPVTLLMTGVRADDPLAAEAFRFLDNELSSADVNTFAGLARSSDHVQTLDRATLGDRTSSARYTEIMAPLGLGDEMRAALVAGPHCWGVMCLHREDGPWGSVTASSAWCAGWFRISRRACVVPWPGTSERWNLLRFPGRASWSSPRSSR